MRLPLRALHWTPASLCTAPHCASQVFDEPLVRVVPVLDAIGLPYAYDLQFTQGFYTCLLAYVLLASAREALRAHAQRGRDDDEL